LAKTLAILQQNNASSACLGFLGQGNTNRIIYIFILLPKVAKAGKAIFVIDIYTSLCHHCFHEKPWQTCTEPYHFLSKFCNGSYTLGKSVGQNISDIATK
jgi:hypothetical protein